ncbi:uncharacterized protein LOC125869643 [Solanum stenotomum]|uniref:uncharacterized protein LOC125869643 n=1 Tax=Solanum stenotomum TaxID=172797 RepID=UPI0020D11317|nr:uncharacterized protein LOC125869643 [Solanum stenotomum]
MFGNEAWMWNWGHISTEYGLPNVSDHAPMMIHMSQGPKPPKSLFRFFNVWKDHANFIPIVTRNWTRRTAGGNMKHVWYNLKKLKAEFKQLNDDEFKHIGQKVIACRNELEMIQTEMRSDHSNYLIMKEKEVLLNLEKWSMIEESVLKQKARVNWISLGDANTKYFSAVMKEKQQRKHILNLTSQDGANLKEAEDIKLEIVKFYKGLMGTAAQSLPAVNVIIMQQGPFLSHEQQYELNKDITDAEILEGLNQIGSDKSPGVDGYNATFYKAALPVIKADIIAAVQEFFALAGFIPGRKIVDNVILAHELVQAYTRKHISPRCMLKIDLQKAYDSVEWVYLRQILEYMKFPTKVIGWIMECVQTVSYTISINGEYTSPFATAKRLRLQLQWNILVGGYMNCSMMKVIEFSTASGLKANLNKSSVYFGGVSLYDKDLILQHLGFVGGELPFKYFGIPLSTKKLKLIQWQPFIEKIVSQITSWTTKKLSYAGRVQLVQTVLFGIQSYWSQMFPLPSKVVQIIKAYCRSYVWAGTNTINKKTLIAWDTVCSPKSVGGFNIINLLLWNKAAIAKLYWDLTHKQDSVWIRWIHAYYFKTQNPSTMVTPQQACWMIKKIMEARRFWALDSGSNISGKRILRQNYLELLGNRARVPWKVTMFSNTPRPKAVFIMWVQLHAKMLTKDRLRKWGLEINPTCVLCNQEDETWDHLFAQCEFTMHVWAKMLLWMQRQNPQTTNWNEHLQWVIKNSKGKTTQA